MLTLTPPRRSTTQRYYSLQTWASMTALILCLTPATEVLAADCNNNGIDDVTDIAAGTSFDCDQNGVPDDCQESAISENFNEYAPGQDPANWFDTDAGSNTAEADNFNVEQVGSDLTLGTFSTATNLHSHFVGPSGADLSGMTFTGRVRISDSDGGIGVTFLSQFSDQPSSNYEYLRIRRANYAPSAQAFHLAPPNFDNFVGTVDSGVNPSANTWYRFRIVVDTTEPQLHVQANFWEDGQSEPAGFQIDATDPSGQHQTSGTIGVWCMGGGGKFWDDLEVFTEQPIALCDDGDACTACDILRDGICAGLQVDCSELDDNCNTGICNAITGICEAVPFNEGGTCDDQDACTVNDACATGNCTGSPVDCSSIDTSCSIGVCNSSTGLCESAAANEGQACEDANPCTPTTSCALGICTGSVIDCSYLDDVCTIGICDVATGLCEKMQAANGTNCDDLDVCTEDDSCDAGVCMGSQRDCSAFDNDCLLASCNPSTGFCETPSAPDCDADNMPDACEFQVTFSSALTVSSSADGPQTVLALDLDGDGDNDVLSGSFDDEGIVWYENIDGRGTFGLPILITASANSVRSVFAADLDNDGDPDVFSASAHDDKIAWYENLDGLGTFGSQQIITLTANSPRWVVAADLDDDGDLDLLSSSFVDDKIAWYENTDALGGFGPQQVITSVADGAQSVFAADLDNDGDLDVLSASANDDKIAWYENIDGLGGFGPQRVIATSSNYAYSVVAGDLDGDGDADALFASQIDDKIAWSENRDGLGDFGPPQVITILADGANSVIAVDLDDDGDLDVLASSQYDSTVAWYENINGLGTFGPQQVVSSTVQSVRSVFAADLDNDGDFDVLSASYADHMVAWYENTVAHDCNENDIPDDCDVLNEASDDCNTNGVPDECELAGDDCNNNEVLDICESASHDCNANDVTDVCDIYAQTSRDCNGNSVPDECESDCNENGLADECDIAGATSIDCNGNGIPDDCEFETVFLGQRVITDATNSAYSVFGADLNGDGDVDVLSASRSDDKIAWYENTDGWGSFGPQQLITNRADNAVAVFAADLDGDGDFDAVSGSTREKIAWYENVDGLGTFGPKQVVTTATNSGRSVFAADLDGDGALDLLAASNISNITWYRNIDGLGTFGPQLVITTATDSAYSVFAADMDNDGDIDVLSASAFDDKIAWYENLDGLGTFGPQQIISTAANGAYSVFAADLDGDGDADVLSASSNDDKIAWYENTDGLGTFDPQQIISTAANGAYSVFAADLDGDGDADVFSASNNDDKIAWYENLDGLGSFGAQQVITLNADGAACVFATDLDGDGDADVLSASRFDDKIAWYENSFVNDCNENGTLDECDIAQAMSTDCNQNQVPDECELAGNDCNSNGELDVCDAASLVSDDCNTNSIPDECELPGNNCNSNGVLDECDIANASSTDCNNNTLPDECELDGNDCNSNGVPDDCDLAGATSTDCNNNAIPDHCELPGNDCNSNSVPDDCDIAGATSVDCNYNAIPDSCELASASVEDCNANGIPDKCDISGGTSTNCNNNSVPDDCEPIENDCNFNGLSDACEIRTLFAGPHEISTVYGGGLAIVAADIDGDSDLDLISWFQPLFGAQHTIVWYEHLDGRGNFGPQQIITTAGLGVQSVFAGDLDGDGDNDLLAIFQFGAGLAWYENLDGLGAFATPKVIDEEVYSGFSVFADDLDGDGDLDVVSASYFSPLSAIVWHENTDGLASFGPARIITTDVATARSVITGDMDGDGDADVISASDYDDKIAWYENTDGLGSFGPQQIITTNADGAQSVHAADLDGDGDLDIISASGNDNKIASYENIDGMGTFGPQRVITTDASGARSVHAADLDGDGDDDVLSASTLDDTIAWYQNTDGLGGFGPGQPITVSADGARFVLAVDLDDDGDVDVLFGSSYDSTIAWYENSTLNDCNHNGVPDDCDISNMDSMDCNFNSVPDECEPDCNANGVADACDLADLSSTDCNTNGVPDECEPDCNTNGAADACDIGSLLSADCNTNGVPDECEPDCDATGVADDCEIADGTSADCNGNGTPDSCEIAGGTATDCNGDGVPDACDLQIVFSEPIVISTETDFAISIFSADLDGDGDADVLSASLEGDLIAWYANTDGAGSFGIQQVITTSADGAYSVFATDLDNDGDLDVLSASLYDNKIAWYENADGKGGFGPQRVISTSALGPISVHAADLDGDGDADVLSASNDFFGPAPSFEFKIAWYENTDGLGGFGPLQIISTAVSGATSVSSADLDGDGDLDVLSSSSHEDKIAWYENTDGLGVFGPQQVISNEATNASSVFSADLDGDGDMDVLSTSDGDDTIAWYKNVDGLGRFGQQQIISTAGYDTGFAEFFAAAADLDGDGDVDVLSASTHDRKIAWYENTDGLGTFGLQQVINTTPSTPTSVLAADLDGDTDLDVVSARYQDDTIAWFEVKTTNDCNHNRTLDECDVAGATSTDCDSDSIPDECEPDADQDGAIDDCDLCAGGAASGDSDANGIVTLIDFANLAGCFDAPGGTLGEGCECLDFDSDGDSDLYDFAKFQSMFKSLGDFDGDGDADLDDYLSFNDCLGGPGTPPNPSLLDVMSQDCMNAFDFNGDGDIDLRDFAAFQAVFGP